jgi:biopolymer transport protein ExbB/TolQ
VQRLLAIASHVLTSPIVWGTFAAMGFFSLVHHDLLPASEFIKRYTTEEWVEVIETTFFFIGLSELLLKTFDIGEQRSRVRGASLLGERASELTSPAEASLLLDRLAANSGGDHHDYLPRRLREALESIAYKKSAEDLADDLKYLSDLDADRSHAGFAFLRIIIWSIPIWGFLGTVVGITDAIASLDPGSVQSSLGKVTASLGGVFDTTALALALSIGLMFGQFFVERFESLLLHDVDRRASDELIGRFQRIEGHHAVHSRFHEQFRETIVQVTESVVCDRIQAAIDISLAANVQSHARILAEAGAEATRLQHRDSKRLRVSLDECSASVAMQCQLLTKIVDALGEVAGLERALNRNLSAIAGAKHLQETLQTLSAGVNLLNARMSHAPSIALNSLPEARREAA